MIKAVIFDMDGVLIDTEKWLNIYWQQAAKEAGKFFHIQRGHGRQGLDGGAGDVRPVGGAVCEGAGRGISCGWVPGCSWDIVYGWLEDISEEVREDEKDHGSLRRGSVLCPLRKFEC